MSKIQKKKALGDKKKRKTSAAAGTESVSGSQVTQSTSSVIVKKTKIEKKGSAEAIVVEPGFFGKAMEFLREVKVELKKVTWPTRKQTTGTTNVVIVFVFVVAAFLGLFDYSLSKLVQVVLT